MANRICIKSDSMTVMAEFNHTKTAKAIWAALPLKASASTWGDEVYFSISVNLGLEQGQDVVELGDLGYWPPGQAFCIFFGKTPNSTDDEIRPASPVTVIGKIMGDIDLLKQVESGASILIEAVK